MAVPGDINYIPPSLGGANYDQLKTDASNYYLSQGGNQAEIDAYFNAHAPGDYTGLARDAAQWYADPGRHDLNTGTDAYVFRGMESTPGEIDQRNQNVGGYFGISAPPAGQSYDYGRPYDPASQTGGSYAPPTMPGAQTIGNPWAGNPWDVPGGDTAGKGLASPPLGSDLNWQGSNPASMNTQFAGLDPARQEEYVKTWLGLDPGTQAQWAAAFGYGPQASGGWGPMSQGGGGMGGPTPPGTGGGAGGGLTAPPMGGPGSLSRAMAAGQQAGGVPGGDYSSGPGWDSGDVNAGLGGAGNNWVGGPYSHEAAWEEPFHQRRDGTMQYAPGYGPGANGGGIKWEGGKTPTGGYTQAGQDQMRQPLTAGGQKFNNFKQFIKYMMQSTPGEQGIKKQLEGFDQQGGALEPGEKSLFDLFAPYLAKGSLKIPQGATPFTNWNPTGLLDMLMKSGVLTRPPGT